MVVAAAQTDDGRKVLVLGLEQENIDRLLGGQPIVKRLDGLGESIAIPGLEEWDVTILGPSDTVLFVTRVAPEALDELLGHSEGA